MPRNILISNADGLLGIYLAGYYLIQSDDVIHCLAGTISAKELNNSISRVIDKIHCPGSPGVIQAELASRLIIHSFNPDCADVALTDSLRNALPVSEVWLLPSGRYSDRRFCELNHASLLRKLQPTLSKIGIKNFNIVTDLWADAEGCDNSLVEEQRLAEYCTAYGANCRIFSTALIVGENPASAHTCRDGFLHFLGALHEIKCEIEERIPDYFEFHALRCYLADLDTEVHLVAVDDAVKLMLDIANHEGTLNGKYRIAAREGVRFADLCDTIGMAYELSLLPVNDRGALNAIDRDFDERIAEFHSFCASSFNPVPVEAFESAGVPTEQLPFDEQKQHAVFKAIRASQDRARTEWSQRCATMPSLLQQKTICTNGFDLTYFVSPSDGVPVVCLNALGQGLHYWYRLIGDLMRYHKTVIWEPRGTLSPPPPFGLKEQVDDLDAVLRHEGISACHLVAWCTGPKIAVDFHLRRPEAVLSMTFLNSTFKCFGGAEELDTEYERNFEPLCRVLKDHPNMASSVMKSLQSGEEEEIDLLDEADNDQLSRRVLALMNRDLKPHVRAPFQTATGILNYAQQIHDFWSCDTTKKAGEIKVPVLLVSAEYDKVASPAMSQMAAQLFPQSHLVHVRGATHYCLYDRPHFMAELLETFFRDPARLSAHYAGCEEVAYTS